MVNDGNVSQQQQPVGPPAASPPQPPAVRHGQFSLPPLPSTETMTPHGPMPTSTPVSGNPAMATPPEGSPVKHSWPSQGRPVSPNVSQNGGTSKNSKGRTIWIYVNRNDFPITLPHPNDPGSAVTFPPCPDRKARIGRLDFYTNPGFARYVGYKRSITQEPAPDYLVLTDKDVEGAESGGDAPDLLRMSPEKVAEYVQMLAQMNPDIAKQIADRLKVTNPTPGGMVG
jgi:hypothetical protein